MNPLQQIEQQYNFQYPALYHRLYADNMLNWGTFGPDWITHQYPALQKHPPLLLFANDFEIMQLNDIADQLLEFADPDYWLDIKPGLRFIPFAQNGAGDWYCFYLNEQQHDDIPIVLLWHDANQAVYKARNLQDFIFRYMLEAVADLEEARYGLLGEENFTEDLSNFSRTHTPYLSTTQSNIINERYTTTAISKPLISEAQLQQVLETVIAFNNLNSTFKYRE
jgi:hypothetical protein